MTPPRRRDTRTARWKERSHPGYLDEVRGTATPQKGLLDPEPDIRVRARVDDVLHWTWVFTTESETLIVVRKSRGKLVLTEVLGEALDGVIVCDGWRAYPAYTGRMQR